MARIQIITCFSEELRGYAALLRATGDLLSSGKHDVCWNYVSIGRPFKTAGFSLVGHVPPNIDQSSVVHGLALNQALASASGDICVLTDVDMALLKSNWDIDIAQAIQYESIDLFGVEYHHELKKYRGTPGIFFVAFEPNTIPSDFDFRPSLCGRHAAAFKVNNLNTGVWGVPIGSVVLCETGWQLPLLSKHKALRCRCLPCIDRHNPRSVLWQGNDYHAMGDCCLGIDHFAEWHFKGEAFITHRKHSRHGRFSTESDRCWFSAIQNYLSKKYSLRLSFKL